MRTRAEIDAEYNAVVKAFGETVFKMNLHQQAMQEQVKALHQKLAELSQEPSAPAEPTVDTKVV